MKCSYAAVIAAGLLSACSGAATRFYTLEAVSPSTPHPYAGAPFRIDAHAVGRQQRSEPIQRPGRFAILVNAVERRQTERILFAQIKEIAAKP